MALSGWQLLNGVVCGRTVGQSCGHMPTAESPLKQCCTVDQTLHESSNNDADGGTVSRKGTHANPAQSELLDFPAWKGSDDIDRSPQGIVSNWELRIHLCWPIGQSAVAVAMSVLTRGSPCCWAHA